ncbi:MULTISPECIES: GerAB/ArcD/ProY family transporter [Clostridium]|uniref:GerAB/ArcD/ProY family transporter n=1 Tax=Clostridium TaxID=1485 RepID=UPI0008262FF6|nr:MULTISPECIES: GerAB/ArcD/ProY family transporter [Clostridium]PJI08598.1 hypothetical protein CUB90_12330 [Clostridium sp. CT7]
MRYDRFTKEQVIFLTFASGCTNMGFNGTWIANLSGRSGWVAIFVGTLLTIPFVMAALYLSKKCPEHNIFEIIRSSFGKCTYVIIVIINAIINIILATIVLNFFTGMVKTYFLQMTPTWVIMLCVIIMAFLFVNNKILLFGRTVELLTVWYVINYFTGFSVGLIKEFRFENIFPVFDTTILKFGKAVFFSLGSASAITLFVLVMVGHMLQADSNKKNVIKGIVFWAFILSLAVFIMQGISGTELVGKVSFAGVEISRAIYFGDFIRGLELFILATYELICIVGISLYLYCTWIPIKKLFKEKYSIILLIIISIAILVPSIKLSSYNRALFISFFMDYYVILPFVAVILIMAFIGIHIMKKNSGSDNL